MWALDEAARIRRARVELRREQSAAIVAELFSSQERERPRLSGNSKLSEAIRYALSHRPVLERFLYDGQIEIDIV